MNKSLTTGKQHKTGSGILLQILVLVLIVFIISGVVSLVFYLSSTNKLTQKSKDKVIQSKAEDMSSGFGYIADDFVTQIQETLGITGASVNDFVNAIMNKELLTVQSEGNNLMKKVADNGVMEAELLVGVIPPVPPAVPEPLVIVSSDKDLVFSDVPDEVYEILKSKDSYGIIEDGIPEWNMKGETLVVFKKFALSGDGGMNTPIYASAIRSIEKDVKEIDGYFNTEEKKINILMIIVIASFSVVLFIIIFVVLRYLISSRITRPIDELSEAAEKVMEGDLDVVVPVREGEEFVSLKKAFNEMLKSIQMIISRSTDDQ